MSPIPLRPVTMALLASLFALGVCAGAASAAEYSGTLNSNTTWNAGDSVVIVGDLTVAPGITLTVNAGAVVQFRGAYKLQVNGTLSVAGTATDKAAFRPESGSAQPGAWTGIVAAAGSTLNMQHAVIEKAATAIENRSTGAVLANVEIAYSRNVGVYAAQGTLTGNALFLHHNGTSNSSATVSVASGASASLTGSIIAWNTGYGVYSDSATTSLINCTVHANSSYGLYFWYGTATLKNSIVSQNNSQGIYTYSTNYTASYNNVWGNTSGNQNGGTNSVSANPLYADPSGFDLRPTHRSPGRKLGEGGTLQGAVPYDGAQTPKNVGYIWENWDIGPGDFLVEGDLTVTPGVTLTIAPGTNLIFTQSDYMVSNDTLNELRVQGTLVADGTASQKIAFRPQSGTAGAWYGIVALAGASVTVDNATIEKAKYGLHNYATGTMITQSEITGSGTAGLYANQGTLTGDALFLHHNGTSNSSATVSVASGASASLTGSIIAWNTGYGVYSDSATTSLINCTVHANSSYGLYFWYGTATLRNSIVSQNNSQGIYTYSTNYTARYNNVWGNVSGNQNGGTNSVSANPLYADPSGFDLRPTHRSPGRKLGEGGTLQGAVPYDGAQTPKNVGYIWENWDIGPGDFLVEGDLTVTPGVTLTIAPGTNLIFTQSDYMVSNDTLNELRVQGTLVADGTASQKIAFRPQSGTAGAWYGIVALAGASVTVDNATIEKAKYGLHNYATGTMITQSEITGSGTAGLYANQGTLTGDALFLHHNGTSSSSTAVSVASGASASLTNALIYRNTGYGVYSDSATTSLINCTVHANSSYGLYFWYGTATLKNSIVSQNSSQGIYTYSTNYTASYNDVWGNTGGNSNGGSNSISLDPIYVNATEDNLHLQPNSPCIDTGTGTGAPDHDIENQPRPLQGRDPGSPLWDMGAYEFNRTANRYPVADAGPNRTVIKDEPASFSGSGSYDPDGTIVSYAWQFGDGNNGSGLDVTHTYATAGTYTLTLTVTDNGGLTGIDRATIHVNTRPVARGGPDKVAEINETVYFDGSASSDVDGTVVAWQWDFGDGQNASGALVNHRYSASGNFTVTLTVTDDDGATGQDTVLVRVGSPGDTTGPVISHTQLGEQPAGQDVTVVASLSDENGIESAALYYRVTGAASFSQTQLSQVAGNQYAGTIPASAVTTAGVDYYLWARDGSSNQNVSTLPGTAPAAFFHFNVVNLDTQPPAIAHTPIGDGQPEGTAVAVQATVTDASGVDSVRLYFKGGSAIVFSSVAMSNTGGDTWQASIPAASALWPRVEYYLEASDRAAPANTGTLPADAPVTTFSFSVTRQIVAQPGDVIVTEIMADSSLPEPASEWFELYNTTASDIDLTGWEVRDDGSDRFTIGGTLPVIISAHGYLVLGRSSDPQANGSVPMDYVYGGMLLANSTDEIELRAGGTVVDRVAYNKSAGWPITAGAALSLDPAHKNHQDNDVAANWCGASATWAGGDFGSPGEENPACSTPDDTEGPAITHTPVANGQPAGQDVNIQAAVSDPSGVTSVTCRYRLQGTSAWTDLPLASVGQNLYAAAIPGAAVALPGVEYYLEAVDASANQNTRTLPAQGASAPFVFGVTQETEDREGPAISHQPVAGPVEAGTVVPISALVSDRSSVAGVDLYFRARGAGAYQHLAMAAGTGGLYTAEIPAAAVILPGVEYYLQATDGSPLANLTSLPADFAESPFFFAVQDSTDRDGPVIAHTPPAGPVTEGTAIELRATATDPSGVEDVTVWVYDATQAGFWPLRASPTGTAGEFMATVPAAAVRVPELKYYIEAIDFSPNQNSSRLPANAPDGAFSVTVDENTSLDRDPPVISGVQAEPDPARVKAAVAVQASITDTSGIKQARLFFRMRGTQAFLSVDMAERTGGVFLGEIPAAVVERGVLEFYIEAKDDSTLENTARSPADAPNSLHFIEVVEDELPTDGGCGCGSGPAGISLLPLVFLLRRRRRLD